MENGWIVVTAKFPNGKTAHYHFITMGAAITHAAELVKHEAVSINIDDKRRDKSDSLTFTVK